MPASIAEITEFKRRIKPLLATLRNDFPSFCMGLLGAEDGMFPLPFTYLHRHMLNLIKNPNFRKKLCLAPRGLGKTTIGRALCIERIAYRKRKFIVYIGGSQDLAIMQTENIKREFLINKRLRGIFGHVKNYEKGVSEGEIDGLEEGFSKTASVLFDHTLLLPRGCGQQIRGLNWRNHRPDLIIFDDPENRSELRNENNRKENLKWLQGDVLKCVSLLDKDYEFLYLDTLKHPDALPIYISKMDDWLCIKLGLCTPNGKSLCPEFISDKDIQMEMENHRRSSTLDEFYREFMNIATAPETASFKPEYFKYYNETQLYVADEITGHMPVNDLINVVIMDPARTVTPQSDFSAIVGIGLDPKNKARYIRDIINERMYPDQMYKAAVDMAHAIKAEAIGIEVTSLNEFITGPFIDYLCSTGNSHIQLIELSPRGQKKENRIAALIPAYRRGLMYHNRACCNVLEGQLMSFPNSQYDDVMDAVAYIEEMISMGELYNTPMEQESYGTPMEVEREYIAIENEPGLNQEQFAVV